MLGKGALILVMGAAAILLVLILNLNANATSGVETTVDFYKQTQARLISNSGVEIYLEKMRRDKTLKGTFLDNDLMGGNYDIFISGPDTQLTIRSSAIFEKVSHTSVVKAKREPITMPSINSAIYVSSNNLSLQMSGNNISIDGNDHNTDGSSGPNPPLPGFGVDNPSDSAYVVNNIKPKINRIDGQGGSPSVRTINDATDWLAVTQNIIFGADITLPSGTYSSGTYMGTPEEPKITYADGDVHFSGTMSGDGILVVNGNLTLSGDFTFRGIIIVYGQSSIQTDIVGQGKIYGSTICVGESVDIKAAGNASLYYSSQAINNAKFNLKSSRFEILSWWE
jgi:hypothetical protein